MSNSLTLEPSVTNLGAFSVRRLLPSARRRSVGPFVFWDHFGPVTLSADENMDVRPHPHIGLATLTWLFEGRIRHRDSLGSVQDIEPGAVNWMTAGRGIVHSERTAEEDRGQPKPLHGLQIWLGLPDGSEDVEPRFEHYAADNIPTVSHDGVEFSLIAGRALGAESPVRVYSPLCYLVATLSESQAFTWRRRYPEQAIYVVEGEITVDEAPASQGRMVVLPETPDCRVACLAPARIAMLAGEPIGHRYVWWNFVHSDRQKIQEAAALWQRGGFDRVNGDDEFIPLPEDRPMP
ncbi:MAG: pirin family protein [Xanthomonadales bacterium]|nr:pirin family protein [Xanthomonadales bacterium]